MRQDRLTDEEEASVEKLCDLAIQIETGGPVVMSPMAVKTLTGAEPYVLVTVGRARPVALDRGEALILARDLMDGGMRPDAGTIAGALMAQIGRAFSTGQFESVMVGHCDGWTGTPPQPVMTDARPKGPAGLNILPFRPRA